MTASETEDLTTPGAGVEVTATETAAWSLGGRAFFFEAPVIARLPIGSPVVLSSPQGEFLGQVVEVGAAEGAQGRLGRRIAGQGTLLARVDGDTLTAVGSDVTFEDAAMRQASPGVLAAWQAGLAAGKSTLALGDLRHPEGQPAQLLASGFNRHTFLCGQSGSGKTYTLGVILEQLLLRTTLRMVVLDPNSDYVGLDRIAAEDGQGLADVGPVVVFRSKGEHRLQVRYGRLPLHQQAMVLALDPVADAEAYDALRRATEELGTPEYSLNDIRQRMRDSADPAERALALRIDNLGVATWSIWAEREDPPLLDQLPADWRAAVADLGEMEIPEERSAIVASILTGLWAVRGYKQPVLIVIDEAHNICPQEPANAHQALAIEHATRIAAEGRKYGLYLLLATQSPRKLHANVLSQCENLILMKTNSVADINHIADVFSQVPRGLIAQATGFSLGEGLAAGRISPTPQLFRGGRRRSPEGGADIPTSWADKRD
ncbi:MAG TPA: ATP-binding protein [Actinomycetes bacterium]|nr:ATP-binding protein [Actinomycetes bacterium]